MRYDHSSGDPRLRQHTAPGDGSHDEAQFDLFAQVPDPAASTSVDQAAEALTMPERFEVWLAKNPHVYDTIVTLARRFVNATGKRKLGMQRLVEIARWDYEIATRGAEDFDINNSFTPYLARLVMIREEDLDGAFDLRKAPEADAWADEMRRTLRGAA